MAQNKKMKDYHQHVYEYIERFWNQISSIKFSEFIKNNLLETNKGILLI